MDNHEIVTEKQKKKYFLPHQDLNPGPFEPKGYTNTVDGANRCLQSNSISS